MDLNYMLIPVVLFVLGVIVSASLASIGVKRILEK
jgi:hypothetical protein